MLIYTKYKWPDTVTAHLWSYAIRLANKKLHHAKEQRRTNICMPMLEQSKKMTDSKDSLRTTRSNTRLNKNRAVIGDGHGNSKL